MGIKDLNKSLESLGVGEGISVYSTYIKDLNIKMIGIDGNWWGCKTKSVVVKDEAPYSIDKDESEEQFVITNSINTRAAMFCSTLMKRNIVPVWLFDGNIHVEKLSTCANRKADREKCKEELNNLKNKLKKLHSSERAREDVTRYSALVQKINMFGKSDAEILGNYLKDIGVSVVQSPNDSEIYAAWLNQAGIIDAVYSIDTDVIAAGGNIMIKSFSTFGGEKFDIVDIENIRKKLGITIEQLRDFSIIHGCDFLNRVRLYGPAKIKKMLIETYNWDLDAWISSDPKLQEIKDNINDARRIFTSPGTFNIERDDLLVDRELWRKSLYSESSIIDYSDLLFKLESFEVTKTLTVKESKYYKLCTKELEELLADKDSETSVLESDEECSCDFSEI